MAWPPLGIQNELVKKLIMRLIFFVRINNDVDFLVVDSIKIAIEMVYAIGKH